jgi:hypothetical protein
MQNNRPEIPPEHGNRADDYYYTVSSSGRKDYWSKILDTKVAKSQINIKYVNDVKQGTREDFNKQATIVKLVEQRRLLQQKITETQTKIDSIEKNLRNLGFYDPYELNKIKQTQETIERRRAQYKQERAEILNDIFKKYGTQSSPNNKPNVEQIPKQNPPIPQVPPTNIDILTKLGITTRKEWKNWLLYNHPDKGGNIETTTNVILEGRKRGW